MTKLTILFDGSEFWDPSPWEVSQFTKWGMVWVPKKIKNTQFLAFFDLWYLLNQSKKKQPPLMHNSREACPFNFTDKPR